MINLVKRALIMSGAAVILFILAYFVPVIKDNKMGAFLRGGAVGAGSVAILITVVAIAQRPRV